MIQKNITWVKGRNLDWNEGCLKGNATQKVTLTCTSSKKLNPKRKKWISSNNSAEETHNLRYRGVKVAKIALWPSEARVKARGQMLGNDRYERDVLRVLRQTILYVGEKYSRNIGQCAEIRILQCPWIFRENYVPFFICFCLLNLGSVGMDDGGIMSH